MALTFEERLTRLEVLTNKLNLRTSGPEIIKGTFAGWQAHRNYFVSPLNNVGLNSEETSGTDWRFWAGDTYANRSTAPFRVDDDGNLVATNATITGSITATSGSLGNLNITGTLEIASGGSLRTNSGVSPYIQLNDTYLTINDDAALTGLTVADIMVRFKNATAGANHLAGHLYTNDGSYWIFQVDDTTDIPGGETFPKTAAMKWHNGPAGTGHYQWQLESTSVAWLGVLSGNEIDFRFDIEGWSDTVAGVDINHTTSDTLLRIWNQDATYKASALVEKYLAINMPTTTSAPTYPFEIWDGAGTPALKMYVDTSWVLHSAVATGTAPLAIASTTMVSNLNADMVDGQHAADLGGGTKVTREVPSGSINGTNVTFTLANTPNTGTEELFLNGSLLNSGAGNDYTISTSTITMASAPISGDVLLCSYWY